MLPVRKPFIGFLPGFLALVVPLFRFSPPNLALICVFGRVKDIDWELQEDGPLQNSRHRFVQLRREGYQNASALRVLRERFPMVSALISLLGTRTFLKGQSGDEHEEQGEKKWSKDRCVQRVVCLTCHIAIGCWRDRNHEDGCGTVSFSACYVRHCPLTKVHDNLSEVVGMPTPGKEAYVAHLPFVHRVTPKLVFLDIRNALEYETDGEQYNTSYIPSRSEVGLFGFGDIRRVKHSYRERDRPDPYHLEDPETEKGEELVAHIIEAVVLPSLDYTEEEEARKPGSPKHDEERTHHLPGIVVA